jgi:alkaline phosphatase D
LTAFTRRTFLKTVVAAAGAVAGDALADANLASWWPRPADRRQFPQSVASGDPRPDSVVFWTRFADPDHPGDAQLTLVVSEDFLLRRAAATVTVTAKAEHDGCVRVKIVGLQPRKVYWYRFFHVQGGRFAASPLGRTKTAPAENQGVPVKFALVNCQDYIGRYYNVYWRLLAEDLDFVLHVGDYIYETNGDPTSQTPTPARSIVFDDAAGAIRLGTSSRPFFAAASLDNYRQLYRTYKSDPLQQALHERFPILVIWDDHEYSDDCWGATATYFDGRKDEYDRPRRRNAEQAFFEYTAIDDVGSPDAGVIEPDPSRLYPNARIYRDFRFGRHLHLALTDYRSFRPDHLIPEDAFPAGVPVDRTALTGLLAQLGVAYDAVKDKFAPYIDIDQAAFSAYKPILLGVTAQAYLAQGIGPAEAQARALAVIQGKLDANVVNQLIDAYNASGAGQPVAPITAEVIATLDRGISFFILGKVSLFSTLGARYLVVKDTFDLYAAYRAAATNGAAEDAYGAEQETWLRSQLMQSDATWRVLASSVSFTPLVLDLTGNLPGLPPPVQDALQGLPALLRNRFYLDADDWDGFPDRKRALLDFLDGLGNAVILSGDIHASFANQHGPRLAELTAPAISSATLQYGILGLIREDPVLSQVPGIEQLVSALDLFVTKASPQIRYANSTVNGAVVLRAGADALRATYWQIDGAQTLNDYTRRPLAALKQTASVSFRVKNGVIQPSAS